VRVLVCFPCANQKSSDQPFCQEQKDRKKNNGVLLRMIAKVDTTNYKELKGKTMSPAKEHREKI
jgi:hypothetical protein